MDLKELKLNDEQEQAITKLIQSETDKVRTKYSTELREVKEELVKYKPVEKTEAELALEERIKALEEREKAISLKETQETFKTKLQEAGLPSDLAKYLKTDKNVDELIGEVGSVFNNYFLKNNYKPSKHNANQGITKEEFKKFNYSERAKLFEENPELYKALAN